jgi:hypothetical protein
MTSPDYPILTIPSHELYQLAHIATFIADAIARHRHAGRGRQGREARAEAIRDVAGGWAALDNATGASTPTATSELPQQIDTRTFNAVRNLLTGGPRWADIVSLSAIEGSGWAMVGHVPGLGPVGARVPTQQMAEVLRRHVMTQPAAELAPWAVADDASRMPSVPEQVDLVAFIESLDPARLDARAVARHLRGVDRRTDAAIRTKFGTVDLDAPLVVQPPEAGSAPPRTDAGAARSAGSAPEARRSRRAGPARPATPETGLRYICGVGPQATTTSAPSVPASSAGP